MAPVQIRDEDVAEMRSRFPGLSGPVVINDDVEKTLRRFLKARQGNVDKATDMLRNTLQWRKEESIDTALARPLPDDKFHAIIKYLPNTHHGLDKLGRPLYVDRTGMVDMDKLLQVCTKEEVVHAHIMMMEYQGQVLMRGASEKKGRTVSEMCNIMDVTGASLRFLGRATMDLFGKIAQIDQDNYPEQLGATYVLNAPWVFAQIWKAASLFLDQNTKDKVHIYKYGKESDAVLDEVLEPESAEWVRKFLAGDKSVLDAEGLTPGHRALRGYMKEAMLESQGLATPQPSPVNSRGDASPAGAEPRSGAGGHSTPGSTPSKGGAPRGVGGGGPPPAANGTPGSANGSVPGTPGRKQVVQGAILGVL